jgi:ABC transporter family protein
MNVEFSDVTKAVRQHPGGGRGDPADRSRGGCAPNGAGKTTMLRMMASVVLPNSGRVRLLGRDPGGDGPRRATVVVSTHLVEDVGAACSESR